MEYLLKTLEDLEQFGYKIGKALKGSELIGLSGDLGAGKTTMTKYIGKALSIKEEIISPTFNIVKVYDGDKRLYHIDAYRLENLGYDPILDDYLFDDDAIKVVEWFNYLDEEIFDKAIKIYIEVLDDNSRMVKVEGDLCIDW